MKYIVPTVMSCLYAAVSMNPAKHSSARTVNKILKNRLLQWSIQGIIAVSHRPKKLNVNATPITNIQHNHRTTKSISFTPPRKNG